MSAEPAATPGLMSGRLALRAGVLVLGFGIAAWCAFAAWDSPDSAATERPAEKSQLDAPRVRAATPKADEIELGMSATFTGPSRSLGIELYRGSKAYFDHINSRGGVHGRKVVVRAYDDGYNPGPAIDNTVRLIEEDGVFLLFNYVGTPTTTRCLPLLRRSREQSVLLFCPFTGTQPQRQQPYDEFVFNLRASYYQETAGLVDHFVQLGRKRVAVFYQIDAYGRNGWEGVRAALDRHGLKMTGEATYRRGTTFDASLKQQV
jgi:ABC-type branched-subunit amino acid transport system substrate-binding protein